MDVQDLDKYIYSIPDYPEPGVIFKDVMPLFSNAEALKTAVDAFVEHYKDAGITKIVGPEARGFLIGAPVALELGAGFVAARKPGKLPREVVSASYELEYGTDTLEILVDAIEPGDKVLILDDLFATGGTAEAVGRLVQDMGAELVGYACILELAFLNPRKKLAESGDQQLFSLLKVE